MTTTPFPDAHARRPIATYRALSSRDASSLQRDGQPVYEVNRLASADGRPVVEVLFTDGQWQLADPECDVVPGFAFDAFPDLVFLAREYGPTWNGWDTPVVDRETLADLLAALEFPHRWEGERAAFKVDDQQELLGPREDGLYDLGQLGWTVLEVPLD